MLKKIKFKLGNIYRISTAPWLQYSINPGDATTIFGSSFGENGWNHIIKTLEEYDINNKLKPIDSSLGKFLKHFCPKNIYDLLNINNVNLPIFVYPWGNFKDGKLKHFKNPLNSRFCGPSTDDFIKEEFRRTISLYLVIKSKGYEPYIYPNSFISGSWLISKHGVKKFVVTQGNHRMAILSHLKYRRIEVRINRSSIKTINEKNIKNWPAVKSGKLSEENALKIFNYFFESKGEKISALI